MQKQQPSYENNNKNNNNNNNNNVLSKKNSSGVTNNYDNQSEVITKGTFESKMKVGIQHWVRQKFRIVCSIEMTIFTFFPFLLLFQLKPTILVIFIAS